VFAVQYPDAFGLTETDQSGQLLFNQTYAATTSSATAESVIQSTDEGYAMVGWTVNSETGGHDGWLVKTDSSGNELWNQTYDGAGIYSIAERLMEAT